MVRLIQLTGALAMIVVTFVAYRRIGGTFTGLGAGVVALLVLWESVMVFQSVTFHGWEAVWMVTVAALLPQWIIDPFSPRSRLALAAALAMAVLTLESGLFACAAVAVCFVVWRKKSGAGGRSAMRPLTHLAVLVLVIVCVLWPGAIIRASLIKTPAMYLYRIRLGSEYASVAGGLPTLLRTLLPVLIMGPLASVWLFARHRADIRRWGPPGVLALVYGLSVSRFSLRADYLVPALAPLVCLVGVACDRIGEMRLRVAVAISALTLVAGSWPATRIEAADLAARADLQWLGDLAAGRKSFIAGGNGIPYYLDASAATKPLTVTPDGLSSREAGAYRLLTPSDIAGSLVVLPRRLPALGPRDERIVAACSRIERPTLVVYDCAATTPDGR